MVAEVQEISSTDPVWLDIVELAALAARPVARDFRRWVEADDLRQIAAEYAFKRQDKVLEYMYEVDEETGQHVRRKDKGSQRAGETAMITFLRRRCERHARKEKATALGYEMEDEYFYRPIMVENLIKVWGSGEYDIAGQILDPAEMGGKRKKSLPNEGNDLLAMMADIDSAMKRLDDRHRLVLVRRIVEDETLESIGEEMEISAQRVDQLVDAGVKRVIDFLGGRNPGQ